MNRADFRFLDTVRVRWAEVDMQKIVFNGHYLLYVDTAVAGWWRAMALPYHETMAAVGGDIYVRKATLEYLGSARYDERLAVGVRCTRIGSSSIALATAVFRGEQLLVHGELVYVFADPATQTSKPVPDALRAALLGFEAGEAMFDVMLGRWAEQQDAAMPLRHAAFVDEAGIAAELMRDPADPGALHALARNRFGMPIAAGRLAQAAPGVGQIGAMATHAGVRGAGVGAAVLNALMGAARQRGDHELVLHALVPAQPFYRRAGFAAEGPVFTEAGLPHQAMRLVC